MIICGVDAGLTDTKYCYEKDGEFVFTNVKPENAVFAYTGINADGDGYVESGTAAGGGIDISESGTAAGSDNVFPEFDCVVQGARKLTGLSEFLLVSMGTGTAFLRVTPDKYTHLGGSGFGGGTIRGLCGLTCKKKGLLEIAEIAKSGELSAVDLQIADVVKNADENLLAGDVTASNLYKLSPQTEPCDFAAGILNLAAESLLMMAVFARRGSEKIVCIGGVSNLEAVKKAAVALGDMHKISFVFPENAAFAGALGCQINFELNYKLKGEL
jgi:type II pantothenate kinase